MAIIKTDNSHYTNIANAIRSKSGTETQFKPSEMPQGVESVYNAGYEKGKAESVDYMPYVRSIMFSDSFSEITEDVYLDLSNAISLESIIDTVDINFNKLTIAITDKCVSFQHAFRAYGATVDELKEIEIIGDTKNVTTFFRMCQNRRTLERFIGEIDLSGAKTKNHVDNIFASCSKLKVFTPKSETIKGSISFSSSPDLTDETIQAIIDGLADLTGLEAQTITFHATVKAKLTDEQISTITSKNWTLA